MKGLIYTTFRGEVIAVEFDGNDDLGTKLGFFRDNEEVFKPLPQLILDIVAASVVVTLPERVATAQGQPSTMPVCPHHNKEMKPSKKPGSYFCTAKNPDGSYCKHTWPT